MHLLQSNCVFLIHQAYYSCFDYVRSLVSNYNLTIFFHCVLFQSLYEMYMLFCSGEYTLVLWHQSMWLEKTLYILLVIKPSTIIVCFHIYICFVEYRSTLPS
jgi:hypothetical protein